jgi:hypothetical protein
MWKHAKWNKAVKWVVTCIFAIYGLFCTAIAQAIESMPAPAQQQPAYIAPTQKPTQKPTARPIVTPTPKPKPKPKPTPTATPMPKPQPSHYPPKTVADLHALAAKGDANAIHEFDSESVGLTNVCPQPKREVTVDPSITGQTLAQDLLAYFYAEKLDSDPCGSAIFAYHNQSEAGNGYTAGGIVVNTTDSSGASIDDPNATDVKYQLTLDIGDATAGTAQEYDVNY